MSAPHVGDGRHRVSFDKAAFEQVVLGSLLGVHDKGGISALRLQKLVGVSWPTAFSMLRKLRRSMGERDRGYRLMNEEV